MNHKLNNICTEKHYWYIIEINLIRGTIYVYTSIIIEVDDKTEQYKYIIE